MLTKHLVKAIKNRKSILTQDAGIDWDDIYTQDGPNYYEAITQVARRANNPRATREFIRSQLEPIFSAHQVPFDLKGFEKAYTEFNQAKMSKNIFDKKTKDEFFDVFAIKNGSRQKFNNKPLTSSEANELVDQIEKAGIPSVKKGSAERELLRQKDSKTKDGSIANKHQKRILIDTIKNPTKGMFLGGPSFAEAKEILMKKFGYTEQQIKKLSTDSDPRGYKVIDQIIKGFMIYKSGKPNMFTAKATNAQYEGTMEEIKKKIDVYWAKQDEAVMKQKAKDGQSYNMAVVYELTNYYNLPRNKAQALIEKYSQELQKKENNKTTPENAANMIIAKEGISGFEKVFVTQDSKTKDGIKYPHPRFRIKDDKLFILKNVARKMK